MTPDYPNKQKTGTEKVIFAKKFENYTYPFPKKTVSIFEKYKEEFEKLKKILDA